MNSRWTSSPALHLYTDASGLHGWGADWEGRWLQSLWSPGQHEMDITLKELLAIMLAVYTWGSSWSYRKILFYCNNQAVVDIWERGSTRATHTMALMCLLYHCAVKHNINVCIIHIPLVFAMTSQRLPFSFSDAKVQKNSTQFQLKARHHPD